jgi:hypothetical protein
MRRSAHCRAADYDAAFRIHGHPQVDEPEAIAWQHQRGKPDRIVHRGSTVRPAGTQNEHV